MKSIAGSVLLLFLICATAGVAQTQSTPVDNAYLQQILDTWSTHDVSNASQYMYARRGARVLRHHSLKGT